MRVLKVLGIVGVIFNMIYAQNLNLSGRNYFCLSLGMGVNYVNVPDVVDYVRSISGERLEDFDGALELWLAPEFKIGRNIAVKFEYSYISKNYEVWKSDWRYLFDYELRNHDSHHRLSSLSKTGDFYFKNWGWDWSCKRPLCSVLALVS
jgi:hypothetical protein